MRMYLLSRVLCVRVRLFCSVLIVRVMAYSNGKALKYWFEHFRSLFHICIDYFILSVLLIKVPLPLSKPIYRLYRFRDDDLERDEKRDPDGVNPCGHSQNELRISFGCMRDPDAESVGPCPKCWLPEWTLNVNNITENKCGTPGVVFDWVALAPDDEQPDHSARGTVRWRTFSARAHGEVSVPFGAELSERQKVRIVEMAREGGSIRIVSCSVGFLPADRPIRLARGVGDMDSYESMSADKIREALWQNGLAFHRDERDGYPSVGLGFTLKEETWLLTRKTAQLALNRANADREDRIPADVGSAHVLDGVLQSGHVERRRMVHDNGRHSVERISRAGSEEPARKPKDGDAHGQVPRQTNIGQFFASVRLGGESRSGSTSAVERREQSTALRSGVLRVVSRKRRRNHVENNGGSTLHRFFASQQSERDVERERERIELESGRDSSDFKRVKFADGSEGKLRLTKCNCSHCKYRRQHGLIVLPRCKYRLDT